MTGQCENGILVRGTMCFVVVASVFLVYYLKTSRNVTIASNLQDMRYFENPTKSPSYEGDSNPRHNIVFLKTHKTASSTVAGIFRRYGYWNNLTFVLANCSGTISDTKKFDAKNVPVLPAGMDYNMLTSHVRFNRKEMDQVFHNATYITVIRDTVSQFQSAFVFYRLKDHLPRNSRPIATFMSYPEKFMKWMDGNHSRRGTHRYRNYQMYDLGLEMDDMDNQSRISKKIKALDKELDFVLIAEYMDESLVVLRKLLNWSMRDVTYHSAHIRKDERRETLDETVRARIRKWNSADDQMYRHFNETFWHKLANYAGNFEKDLARLKQEQDKVKSCLEASAFKNESIYSTSSKKLKAKTYEWCRLYKLSDTSFSQTLREKMISRNLRVYKVDEKTC